MEEKKRRGRNPIEGKRIPKKKKDVNGNKLKGRPSFDHTAPVVVTASAFAPSDLSNLYAWYKYDNITQSGGAVSQVSDKSGNGRHAVQATSGSQPLYSATGGANNYPYWTGTDAVSGGRYLLAGEATDWTFLHDGSGFTIFLVFKTASTQQNYFFGTQTGAGLSKGLSVVRLNNTSARFAIGTGFSQNISVDYSQTLTSWSKLTIFGETGSDPDYYIRVNKTDVANTNEFNPLTSTPSIQKLGIGAGGGGAYSISCDLHEVIVYNKVLTTGEVANVENYLTNRYT